MYFFKYREELNTKKELRPIISFGKTLENNENSYYDTLTYFDNLSTNTKKELDKIFEYSKNFSKNGLNKESWVRYLASYNITIPAMTKKISRRTPKPTNGKDIFVNYAENEKNKELIFYNKDLILPKISNSNQNLFESLIKDSDKGAIIDLILWREGTCEDDIQLLYMVLDCLFSSSNGYRYYIKKCEICKKYFLHHLPNKKCCSRIKFVYDYQTTCDEATNTFYQSRQYKSAMRKNEKYLKHFDNDPVKYDIEKYHKEKDKIKKECVKKLNITPFEEYIDNFYNSYKKS